MRSFTLFLLLLGLISMRPTMSRAFGGAPPTDSNWSKIAGNSLRANIIELSSGTYLAAGSHQFRSLWTRDFCFSIRGLLDIGEVDVVRSHLTALIENRREGDNLVPKVMDSMSPTWRNVVAAFFYLTGMNSNLPLTDALKPYYVDDQGSEAIDSNILVLLGALDYVEASHDLSWWDSHEEALVQIFHFYDDKFDPATGLIVQGPYSDWQDSVKREGITFYTNLLFTLALKRLAAFPAFGIAPDRWEKQRTVLDQVFLDPTQGIYRSMQGQPYFSLDANLLALDRGLFDDQPQSAQNLYENLKASPFWQGAPGVPGFNTFPDYPQSWLTKAVSWVGLGHYHDECYWSWLMALSAKVAIEQHDDAEANRITSVLAQLITRDGAVAEIYNPTSELPDWKSALFRSETPFSWGAATTVELSVTK